MFRNEAPGWIYAVIIVTALLSVGPLLWLFLISLNPTQGIAIPVGAASLHNYAVVLFESYMERYFLNTIIVAAGTTLCTLICASLGAYAASRYRFAGRELSMVVLLALSMTPVIAVVVPVYSLAARLQLLNTYQVLIAVFTAWQIPGTLWLIRAFLDGVPVELEEAAQLDGCSKLGAFMRVVLPQLTPGLIASGLMVFVYVWNEFIIAVSLSSQQSMRPVSVGLYFYISEFGIEWGKVAAAAILSLVPVLVLFFVFQRRFIHGLTAGALK